MRQSLGLASRVGRQGFKILGFWGFRLGGLGVRALAFRMRRIYFENNSRRAADHSLIVLIGDWNTASAGSEVATPPKFYRVKGLGFRGFRVRGL